MSHFRYRRSNLHGWWLVVLLTAAPAFAQESPASCTCPLGFGNWMRFEDSNRSPSMPDFWAEPTVEVDEISACSHGVSFVFTTRQDDNLIIASLFFPEPTLDLLKARLQRSLWSTEDLRVERERLMDRYTTLRWKIEEQFGSSFDEYGRVVFRSMEVGTRPKILNPLDRLALEWNTKVFDLRGYLDVYFTQLM